MKPTTEMIEAHAIADAKFAGMDFAALGRADKKRYLERSACCLSAALSVQPAAAVVGEPEPIGYCSEYGLDKLASKAHHYCLSVSKAQENEFQFPIYAAPSAPDGWQSIESAPHACHVIACYFYECEWIYDVVLSPPSTPFTHWKMLPAPPALGGASHE